MQEITKTKCNNIANGTEGRLKDTRDNKWYWVAKLNDGLCWMTQNLDYDGGGTKVTNLSGNFTSSDTTGKYYDPGEYYYTGSDSDGCANSSTGLASCTNNSWITNLNVPSSWSATYNDSFVSATSYLGTDNQTICNKKAGSYLGDINSPYSQCHIYYYSAMQTIAHYAAGNYYNWYAATNGTGTSSMTSGNATGSVCPTGWSLPTSRNSSTEIGSFGGLTTAYSIGNNAAGSTKLRSAPLYFVYGGRVSNSSLNDAGSDGYYWSSTADSASSAYNLYFYSSNVIPSNNLDRYVGLSVRCVAR